MLSSEIICIYHGNCADGFGAAWSVRNAIGGDVEYHAGVYQQAPVNVAGKYVVLVDFCYPTHILEEMVKDALGILIIDHHKSAMSSFKEAVEEKPWLFIDMSECSKKVNFERYLENLAIDRCENCGPRIYGYFDMNRSGAMMAWDFFNWEDEPPNLIKHIQDRDLWRFDLKNTREIQAALFSYIYDFDVWDSLMKLPTEDLAKQGHAIERKHFKDINEFIKVAAHRMTIAGHDVPVLNAPYFYSSDAGHILAQGEKFAACYWDQPDGRVFSLRSSEEGMDVSEIAKQFGGGGHKNAAGFKVPVDSSVA